MKSIVFLSSALLLSLSASAKARDLSVIAWPTSQEKALNGAADMRQSVSALALSLLPDADIDPPRIGEVRFVDLDRDGHLELVATVDYSGRGFFTTVVTFKRGTQGKVTYSMTSINGFSVEDLAQKLRDLDRDGRAELVVQQYVDRYEGTTRAPLETVVYAWRGDRFVDASDQYPAFYRAEVIPALESRLQAIADGGSTRATVDDHDAFVLRIELERARKRGKGAHQ